MSKSPDAPTTKTPRGPRVSVQITEEMIEQAVPRDSKHCMIADGIRAAFPDAKNIAVDLATIRFTDPKRALRYTYLTPRIAQVALVQFDRKIKPEPFNFRISGAHVTRSGSSQVRRGMSDSQREVARVASQKSKREALRRTKIVQRTDAATGNVPDRVGGKAPPLQRGKDAVPFSRRRAFGLRGLGL